MHWVAYCVLMLILMRAGPKITVLWFSLKGMGISILSHPGEGKSSKRTNFELGGRWWSWGQWAISFGESHLDISGGSDGGKELWKIISMVWFGKYASNGAQNLFWIQSSSLSSITPWFWWRQPVHYTSRVTNLKEQKI